MNIALAMIVRDNEATLPRCLASVDSIVDDAIIVDTGSDDDTAEIARQWGADVYEREWRNSGTNRTELMSLAHGKADYLLLLDADHTIECAARPDNLTRAVYMLRERQDTIEWRMPRLVTGARQWRFVGAAHEYLEDADDREPLDAITVTHHADGRPDSERLRVALSDLDAALELDPDDARSVFYRANTLRDLGIYDEAVRAYSRRLVMGGWDEELFYSHYQLGVCLMRAGRRDEGREALIAAYQRRPWRAEPLNYLRLCLEQPAGDILFVEPAAYT